MIRLPITLGASQTWSIDGNENGSQIRLDLDVTGPTHHTLAIALSHQATLGLNGNDVEVGPVTITGGNSSLSGNDAAQGNGIVAIGDPLAGAQLNATNDNPVSLTHAGIAAANAAVGTLTSTGGSLQVGTGVLRHRRSRSAAR